MSPWQVKKGEAADDGAIPANEHFPQTGDRQDAGVLTLVRSTLTELKLAIDGTSS